MIFRAVDAGNEPDSGRRDGCNALWFFIRNLLTLSTLIITTSSADLVSHSPITGRPTNNSSPLTYTRLKHDGDFLRIFSQLTESNLSHEETENKITFDEIYEGNKTRRVTRTYYSNPKRDLNDISEDDLILEALDQTYLAAIFHFYQQDFDNPNDSLRAYDPEVISRELCDIELDYLLKKLELIKDAHRQNKIFYGAHPELMAFFDSYGSHEAGLLYGNYNWLGQWLECSRRHIFDLGSNIADFSALNGSRINKNPIDFKGRYCLSKIKSPSWRDKLVDRIPEYERTFFKYENQSLDYLRYHRIQVGICLPDSCDSSIMKRRPEDIRKLTMFKLGEPFASSYNLEDLYCLPDETSELRQFDLSATLFLCFCTIWICCVGLATMANCFDFVPVEESYRKIELGSNIENRRHEKSILQKLILSFSLIESYRTLVKPIVASKRESISQPSNGQNNHNGSCEEEYSPPKIQDLAFLDFIKVVMMIPIIFGHVGLFGTLTSKYPLNYGIMGNLWLQMNVAYALYVNVFFCITGFMISYGMFSDGKIFRAPIFVWIYSIFHRYWRLAPCYIIYFWFLRSVFVYTGSGPIWDYGTSNVTMRAICKRESWITTFTLTSNWHPMFEGCIVPSWYIANDLQFFIVSPLFLIALYKSSLGGWLLGLISINLLTLLRGWRVWTHPRAQHMELLSPKVDITMRHNWDLSETYLRPYYRGGVFLVGLLAGHYAYMVRAGKWNSMMYSKPSGSGSGERISNYGAWLRSFVAWIGLFLIATTSLVSYFGSESIPRTMGPYAKEFASIHQSQVHVQSGFGPVLLIVAMLFGAWPEVRRFMSHRFWTVLSRLNYFLFLCQVDLIIWLVTYTDAAIELNNSEMLRVVTLVQPSLYAFSFIVTLLLANPLARLEREFIGSRLTRKPKNSNSGRSQFIREADELAAASARGPPEQEAGSASVVLVGSSQGQDKTEANL